MKIRDATEVDLQAIVDIYNAAIPTRMSTADTEPVSVEFRRSWFNAHMPQSRPVWVAEEDGLVLGWLSLESFHGRPVYANTAEVSVYVSLNHRRQDIGRTLLNEAVRSGPVLGLAVLLAFVFGHNTPSLKLFEGAGFAQWGYLPGVANMDGIDRDLVILGRRVDQV